MKKLLILTALSSLLLNCRGAKNQNQLSSSDVTSSVEDVVNTLSSVMDDQSGESYARYDKNKNILFLKDLMLPKAFAAQCIRPIQQACVNSARTSSFIDCSTSLGEVLASGNIELNYSSPVCSMGQTGDEVIRTFDYELIGPNGGQWQVTSLNHNDYRGVTMGGGSKLVKTAAGYDLNILGKRRQFIKNAVLRLDKSVRTLEPLKVTGGLDRNSRRVTDGVVEVAHNIAKITTLLSAENLEWSSSCCHPVSGRLSLMYTGAKQGEGSVEFTSCGQAQIDLNGEVENVQFSYCE